MQDLERAVDQAAAEGGFSGVVHVETDDRVAFARAYGLAHRGYGIANTLDTRFGTASGTKSLTALVVMSLVAEGRLDLMTTARSVLGADLPLIDDDVTVEHLLAHRSGIGDYFDEDVIESLTDYVMPVPVHRLVTTEDYLAVLDDHPQVFAVGTRFAYNNGAFVVLALIAERVSATSFPELVRTRVCEPAGMSDTGFLRSDEPAERTAMGYLATAGPRTNVLHLPVHGSGDGGLHTTAADVSALWSALHAGRIVPRERVEQLLRPRSEVPSEGARHGLGFWLHPTSAAAFLEGADAGVGFRSVHDESARLTHTVLSNTTDGAWQMSRLLSGVLES